LANVFTKVDTARLKMRKQRLEGGDLLVELVATIVDNYVDSRNLLDELFPKDLVRLVPNEHPNPVALIHAAGGLNVHPIDMDLVAEVRLPHIKATTGEDADLDDVNLTAPELREMPVVDREVVAPLP
jgi:hypothetical protein